MVVGSGRRTGNGRRQRPARAAWCGLGGARRPCERGRACRQTRWVASTPKPKNGAAVDALPAAGHRAERGVRHLRKRPGQYPLAGACQPLEVTARNDGSPGPGTVPPGPCAAKWVSIPWIDDSAPAGVARVDLGVERHRQLRGRARPALTLRRPGAPMQAASSRHRGPPSPVQAGRRLNGEPLGGAVTDSRRAPGWLRSGSELLDRVDRRPVGRDRLSSGPGYGTGTIRRKKKW